MFDIVEFITNLFKKNDKIDTGLKAKERLKLVLISDRATVSPHIMEALREELLEVISRYMTVDAASVEMGLQRTGNAMALAANIPVISMKRNEGRIVGASASTMTKVKTSPSVRNERISSAKEMVKEKITSPTPQKDISETNIIADDDDFDPNMDSQEIISVSTISEITDDNDSDGDDGDKTDRNKSGKRTRRYKTRTSTARRTSRKKTRV
jgi:cell division topological specificity factor